MSVKTDTTFVYGHFKWPEMKRGFEPPPGTNDFAIKVLREYSANEFVGKLYRKLSIGDWVPVDPSKASEYEWYRSFRTRRRKVSFEMDGSGIWEVQNFRIESDETGPYVAVALRYSTEDPAK
ncbi:MAG: hypothetical protein ACRD3T_11395 [Terriglobia bacterium]